MLVSLKIRSSKKNWSCNNVRVLIYIGNFTCIASMLIQSKMYYNN